MEIIWDIQTIIVNKLLNRIIQSSLFYIMLLKSLIVFLDHKKCNKHYSVLCAWCLP